MLLGMLTVQLGSFAVPCSLGFLGALVFLLVVFMPDLQGDNVSAGRETFFRCGWSPGRIFRNVYCFKRSGYN